MNNHVLALDANGTFSAQTLNLPLLLSHRTLVSLLKSYLIPMTISPSL